MKLLIDGDSFIYKIGFAFEVDVDWGDGETCYYYKKDVARKTIDKMIEGIKHHTNLDEYELWLTPKTNFRNDNPLGYKQNRAGMRKPCGFDDIKEYLVTKHKAQTIDYLEADDVVVYKKTKYPDEYILVAQDKDVLYQTVGTHFNYNKNEFVTVNEYLATKFKYVQCLAGDAVDGYRGCPGIGMKRANAILDKTDGTEKGYWEAVVTTYESKAMTEEDAINTMRLADMHQYNGDEIILFTPPV